MSQNEFPHDLKLCDINTLCKKDEATDKRYYRPITVFCTLSKVFECLLYSQMTDVALGKVSIYSIYY